MTEIEWLWPPQTDREALRFEWSCSSNTLRTDSSSSQIIDRARELNSIRTPVLRCSSTGRGGSARCVSRDESKGSRERCRSITSRGARGVLRRGQPLLTRAHPWRIALGSRSKWRPSRKRATRSLVPSTGEDTGWWQIDMSSGKGSRVGATGGFSTNQKGATGTVQNCSLDHPATPTGKVLRLKLAGHFALLQSLWQSSISGAPVAQPDRASDF